MSRPITVAPDLDARVDPRPAAELRVRLVQRRYVDGGTPRLWISTRLQFGGPTTVPARLSYEQWDELAALVAAERAKGHSPARTGHDIEADREHEAD